MINVNKLLHYWQWKATSRLPPAELGWYIDRTPDIPYT